MSVLTVISAPRCMWRGGADGGHSPRKKLLLVCLCGIVLVCGVGSPAVRPCHSPAAAVQLLHRTVMQSVRMLSMVVLEKLSSSFWGWSCAS